MTWKSNQRWNIWVIEVPKEEKKTDQILQAIRIQENSSGNRMCENHLLKKISGYLQISTMDDKH